MQQITWTNSNILDRYIPHRTKTLNADHTSSITFKYRTPIYRFNFQMWQSCLSFVFYLSNMAVYFLLFLKTVQGNDTDSQENKPDCRLGPMTAYLWTDLEWSKHSYRAPDKGYVFVIAFGTYNRCVSNQVTFFQCFLFKKSTLLNLK